MAEEKEDEERVEEYDKRLEELTAEVEEEDDDDDEEEADFFQAQE